MNNQRPQLKRPMPPDARKVFSGVIFDVYQWQQTLYDGTKTTFEQLKRPDSVNILPVTTEGKITLTKQEQPGAQPFIGTLGGRVDPGESASQAAARELMEEAGLAVGRLDLWDATQVSEKIDWIVWTFIARDCREVNDQRGDAGEKIELFEVSFDEYMDIVIQDDYRDSELALKLLRLSRQPGALDAVKQEWRVI